MRLIDIFSKDLILFINTPIFDELCNHVESVKGDEWSHLVSTPVTEIIFSQNELQELEKAISLAKAKKEVIDYIKGLRQDIIDEQNLVLKSVDMSS